MKRQGPVPPGSSPDPQRRSLPPPRPGYHRDADPDGEYEADYTPLDYELVEKVTTEWNLPVILAGLCVLMFGVPIAIILWALALSWL